MNKSHPPTAQEVGFPPPLPVTVPASLAELEQLSADADHIVSGHEESQDSPKASVWPTLPSAALHGLAGDIVRLIGPHSEADPAAILIQALVAAGNIVGPGLHCSVESTRHALNLDAILVGDA